MILETYAGQGLLLILVMHMTKTIPSKFVLQTNIYYNCKPLCFPPLIPFDQLRTLFCPLLILSEWTPKLIDTILGPRDRKNGPRFGQIRGGVSASVAQHNSTQHRKIISRTATITKVNDQSSWQSWLLAAGCLDN